MSRETFGVCLCHPMTGQNDNNSHAQMSEPEFLLMQRCCPQVCVQVSLYIPCSALLDLRSRHSENLPQGTKKFPALSSTSDPSGQVQIDGNQRIRGSGSRWQNDCTGERGRCRMLACNRLRIDPCDGSPVADYRIENGCV